MGKENNINIELDYNVYTRDGIMKCLYWYSSDNNVNIELINNKYIIQITPYNKMNINSLFELEKNLKQELLDYNLRDIVKKETTTIRELIIAKAFSNGEFDEEPKGDLMDPLGIKFL